MGKFKIGDRVRRVEPSDWPKQYGAVGKEYTVLDVPSETTITVIANGTGAMASAFELIAAAPPTITIEPSKHYRCRNGKVTGRIAQGDIGFEAVVDGSVKVFDKAGGHVFGDGELDIVEAWVPKVGERVRFTQDNPNGGRMFGSAGYVAYVTDGSRIGGQVAIQHPGHSFNPHAPISALEPLPVAAPLRIEAGRFYKTRDGRKVGPMVKSTYNECFGLNGEAGWYDDGLRSTSQTSGYDLISEWVDEPVTASNDNAAPAAAKFKVGDRVVYVGKEKTYSDKRKIGWTGSVRSNSCSLVSVDWDNGGWSNNFLNNVALIENASPQPTAIVCLIESGQPKPSAQPHVHASVESATTEAERLAGVHRGQQFGVYVLHDTRETDQPDYGHEWKNLAARGQKIAAIKELRGLTGLNLVAAKAAVEKWTEYELAA